MGEGKPTFNILSAVLPIIGASEKLRPVAVGTGFLLQVADSWLLVSAAHVADEIQLSTLYIPGEPGKNLIELPSSATCTKAPSGDRKKDKIDLAFWELTQTIREQLDRSSMFLPSLLLQPHVEGKPPQHFSFVGFPHKATKEKYGTRKLQSRPEQYTGVCVDEARYQEVGASSAQNIAIDFDPKQAISEGKQVTPKDRRGMSGGPVFAMTDGGTLNGLPKIRIVGVAIECHRSEKLLLATKVDLLLQMLAVNFGLSKIPVSDAKLNSSL